MSDNENTDDLEQTCMLAAAAANSRQYEEDCNNDESVSSSENTKEDVESVKTDEIHYYTQSGANSSPQHVSSSVENSAAAKKIIKNRQLEDNKESTVNNKSSSPRSAKKRTRDEIDDSSSSGDENNTKKVATESSSSHSEVVATHYNLIEDKGLKERSKSRIIYLRIFHNWIKSMLINEYLTKIKDSKKQHNPVIRVHDMCSGKGGDLSKWKKGNITHLICSDIAEVSLDHCKQRYADLKQRSQNERGWNSGKLFSLELVHGDAGQVRYREKYSDPSIKLDLVSCQFAFHYSFESLPQAEFWFKNAAECLLAGGYFIGTMIDSNEIISRARKNDTRSFGNDVFQVTLDFDPDNPPIFGGQYNFHLDGVVNCPEFLVHFPTFVKVARKYGLKLIRKEKFLEFFERMKDDGRQLLTNMGALETYPSGEGRSLVGDAADDYNHAKEFIAKQERKLASCGTLSKSEWEASSLYLTFAFQKLKNTWNADGTPCYIES